MRDFYLPVIATMAMAASVLATEIPAACPSKDLINDTIHTTVLLPHECKCANYYECRDGESVLKQCDSGEKFDHIQRKCVTEEEAVCSTVLQFSTATTPRTTASLLSDTENICDISLTECPPKGSHENRTLPHPCLCDRYYLCVDGESFQRMCPEGKEYDYIRRICVDPETFKCIRPIPGCGKCNGTCIIRDPDLNDCTWYYECQNGVKEHKQCHKGLQFNPDTRMCDLPQYVNCPKACTDTTDVETYCRCPDTTGHTFPHECECNKYYICVNKSANVQSCPPGQAYDRVQRHCEPADKVICGKSPNNKL